LQKTQRLFYEFTLNFVIKST